MIALEVLFWFASYVAAFLFRGWVVKTLWWWFVTPAFHLAGLGLAQALGLRVFWRVLNTSDPGPPNRDKGIVKFVGLFAYSLVGLGFGWVLKQCL